MKTIFYNLLFLVALFPSITFCGIIPDPSGFNGKHSKEKKIIKEFKVSAHDLLKIDNSYGNIDISTWDKNVVSIQVFIKTNGDDEQKVLDKLEEINIEFNQNSAGVSAKTHFSRESNSWWSVLFGNNSNVNMEINYIIKAPTTNNMDLNNDYGNIYLDKLTGNSKINCDYGKIDIRELHGNNNSLNFDYSRNCHFGYIKKATINADYSEFTIDDAEVIDLNADYTTSNFKKVELLKFNCDYGEIKVDKVKKISGNGDYLNTDIGLVFQSAELKANYGSLSIDKVVKDAGNIQIESNYAGIKIGYDSDHPFRFSLNITYGNVNGMDNFEVSKQNRSSTNKSYEGYNISDSNNSNINISSNYANISFQPK
jgi:hypothetical protein